MDINFFFKNLSPQEEKALSEYVEQKRPAIETLLTKFAPDAQNLKVSAGKFEKHNAFEVEFCLTLPNKSVVAKETSHAMTKGVDLAKDRLVAQIKKHLAQLRGPRLHRSLREQRVPTTMNMFEEIGF